MLAIPLLAGFARAHAPARAISTTYCAPSDTYATEMLAFAKAQASGTDAAWRQTNHFPAAPANQVVLVADESVCQRVGSVLYAGVTDPSAVNYPIYVVAIGSGGYLTAQPSIHAGEYGVRFIVDAAITKLIYAITS
jgi:hypothetical protein